MPAQIPSSESTVFFDGKYYKLWRVRYDLTETTFTVNQSATSISVVEPASSQPAVSMGAPSNGEKTATIAAGGAANGNGNVILITAHGLTVNSGAG